MAWSRSRPVCVFLPAVALGLLLGQTPAGVGDGAPDSATLASFLVAFNRGTFSSAASLPPRDKVHRVGPGYVQDFNAADPNSGFSYLLAQADSIPTTAFQMCCQILAVHTSIGSFTGRAGYPIGDPIPAAPSPVDNAANLLQNFEGGHVIIFIQSGAYGGQTFFIRDPYVSLWRVTPALALPISQEHDTASKFSTAATQQDFQGGVIVQITSGSRRNQIYTVSGVMYQKYFQMGATSSFLGYPIGDEFTLSGRQRQNFEGGYLDYVPGSGQPAEAHAPVASVVLDATPLNLQVGNVVQIRLGVFDSLGAPLSDRPVTWTTSNRSVVQLETSGLTATLRAVGPGFANVQAFADGVASATLRITVTSVCCLVGEGAPTLWFARRFRMRFPATTSRRDCPRTTPCAGSAAALSRSLLRSRRPPWAASWS